MTVTTTNFETNYFIPSLSSYYYLKIKRQLQARTQKIVTGRVNVGAWEQWSAWWFLRFFNENNTVL